MKTYKPMGWQQFADHLMTMKPGEAVEFATCCDVDLTPDLEPDFIDLSEWYFAKLMKLEEYASQFILFDYCGGEEAYAIPKCGYRDEFDGDDYRIIPIAVKQYFQVHLNLDEYDKVYVEIEDD